MTAWAMETSVSASRALAPLLASSQMPTSPAPARRETARPSREAPSLEASLIATVAPVMRHLLAHARRRRAWSELTYQQYNVLRMIDTMGPQPQAEVARRLLVTAPVVTRLASTLADAGLVERQADPADKRTVLLALTATGRRRARAMRRDLLAAARDLMEPIPDERRDAVSAALDELQVLLPQHSARR